MPVKIQPTDSQTQSTNLLFVQVIIVHVQVVTGSSVCFFHHACMLNRLVGYILPIMPELFSMLESTNYAKNYASIMWTTLQESGLHCCRSTYAHAVHGHCKPYIYYSNCLRTDGTVACM